MSIFLLASFAFIALAKSTPGVQYVKGTICEGNFCPPKSDPILSKDECKIAASSFNLKYGGTGHWDECPKGCFLQYGKANFNEDFNGKALGNSNVPICKVLDFDCSDMPASMNGGQFEKGCKGAVYQKGNPSKDYCLNSDGLYPWWEYCCKWEGNTCIPKGTEIPYCAIIYQHGGYGGNSATIKDNTEVLDMTNIEGKDFDNRVSSVKVSSGCTFTGYTNANKEGTSFSSTVVKSYNDHMSSFTCSCGT